jgi:hypothetical protein
MRSAGLLVGGNFISFSSFTTHIMRALTTFEGCWCADDRSRSPSSNDIQKSRKTNESTPKED